LGAVRALSHLLGGQSNNLACVAEVEAHYPSTRDIAQAIPGYSITRMALAPCRLPGTGPSAVNKMDANENWFVLTCYPATHDRESTPYMRVPKHTN